MARPKSEFLKALGVMFEIWKALTEEVLSRQGTDEDLRRVGTDRELRGQLAGLIVAKGRKFALTQEPKFISIDRSAKFNAARFFGQGWWSIVEENERSLALTELDIMAVRFEHTLESGETYVKGETKLERLKEAGHVRLDARIFQTLWENQHLIPEHWKEKTDGNTTYIFFDGTILQDSDGDSYVLYLYWSDGKWRWDVYLLERDCYVTYPSAVLAS